MKFKVFFRYYNFIKNFFFIKFINLLILKGKKLKIEKFLFKFFNILIFKFKILNPLLDLLHLFYINLIPSIRPIRIGFKMKYVTGFFLDPFSRLNYTFRLFIKSVKNSKTKSLVNSLLIEYFKLKYNKDCRLILHNKHINSEIEQFDLLKRIGG